MMAHSAETCQCNSRTPPAVRRISTPAMVLEIGSSRAVTCRVHPPLSIRLRDSANEYLKGGTVPLSVSGGQTESGFSASSAVLLAPGWVSLGAVCAPLLPCDCAAAAALAARTVEATPINLRRVTSEALFSMANLLCFAIAT